MAGPNSTLSTAKPSTRAFTCPNCGGQVTLHAPGHSLTASCRHCEATISVLDENYQLVAKAEKQLKIKPIIPLGRRGKFEDIEWECIGMMERHMKGYKWHEYLLFNPVHGYRWLVQSLGHWSYVKPIIEGVPNSLSIADHLQYDGQRFAHYDSGHSKVTYVLGEFFWKVKAGDKNRVMDFVAPPLILSCELSQNELNWSLGEYVEHKELKEAFGEDLKLPPKKYVGANQPNPYKRIWKQVRKVWLASVAFIALLMVLLGSLSSGREVFSVLTHQTSSPDTLVYGPIAIDGYSGNVEARLTSNFYNSWHELWGTLRNVETQDEYGFHLSTEYYSGISGGETWSEGNRSDWAVLGGVPSGSYELIVESYALMPTTPGLGLGSNLVLRRNVFVPSNFIIMLILVSIFPLILLILSSSYEKKRFEE